MIRTRLTALVFAALSAGPALAQSPAAGDKIVVPFGETAMVADPCPPQPAAPILKPAEPGKPAAYAAPEVLAAWQRYGAWKAANDWPDFCHYQAENRALTATKGPRPRVVFMGDSITELWRLYDPGFFTNGVVDRGISGQTTPQMVTRFYPDVVALKPRIVHIMAGTNDIAGNTGVNSEAEFKANIAAMVDLARANGIQVVLASIPPTKTFSWRKELKPAGQVRALNAWLKAYAAARGAVYADYYAGLTDAEGGMKAAYSLDGVHPVSAGYAVMKAEALKALARAEARKRGR